MSKEDKVVGVYMIVNDDQDKAYVGSTTDLEERCKQHFYLLRRGKHPNKRLQKVYNKDPELNFVGLRLESHEEALDYEQAVIDEFKPGELLNISRDARYCRVPGLKHTDEAKAKIGAASKGNQYRLGKKLTDEAKAKLSASLIGRLVSEETRKKIGNANRGKTHTQETIERISKAKTGVKQDPEVVERRAAALRGKPLSEQHVSNLRQANVARFKSVSIDGVLYPSINEAARSLNINPGTVYHRIGSPSFPTWKYEESA